MKNVAATDEVLNGKVYMVEMLDGEINSFLILNETPTHYIFSFSKDDTVEVFQKSKEEVVGVYEVREWWDSQGEIEA